MTLDGLNTAFRTAAEAQAEVEPDSFYGFSDLYNTNGLMNKTYPVVWCEYPNSVEIRAVGEPKGYEHFTLVWRIFDLQKQKTEKQKVTRITQLETMGYNILNELVSDTNAEIMGVVGDVAKERADNLFNQKVIGVMFTSTVRVFTGWDCN